MSIVLALGIADILRFLADVLREPGARRLYWVHMLWVVLLLELHVEFWWRLWGFQSQLSVGPELALVILGPALLFMASRIMLPGPRDSADMAVLYYGRRTAFFSMMIAMFAACMFTANRRVHAGVVLVIVGLEVAEVAGRLLKAVGTS